MPRIPRPAARIVIEVPGRTSRTMPATGVSSGSTMSPVGDPPAASATGTGIRRRAGRGPGWPPPAPTTRPIACQRSPGRGSTGSVTILSSRRGSRRRSAIGAPTTTEAPASTIARSPGERAKTASTGDSMRRRNGTSSRSVAGPASGAGPSGSPRASPGCQPLPIGCAGCGGDLPRIRAAPGAGRRARAGAAARRAGRRGARPGRPTTSTAKWRPRPPRRTLSWKRNSAVAVAPGGRATIASPPGIRSIGLRLRGVTPPGARGRSWTTRLPALRPVLSPAGVTTLPSGASMSSARSAMTARRSSGSGIEPSGPSRRA